MQIKVTSQLNGYMSMTELLCRVIVVKAGAMAGKWLT